MTPHYYKIDERRIAVIPGDQQATVNFAANLWLEIARASILDHGFFAVALSGGSTPKKIFLRIVSLKESLETEIDGGIDWSKVYLFWSDERSVAPTHPDSNYRMAMEEGGLATLPIPNQNIFRMVVEGNIEAEAVGYEELLLEKLGAHPLDLVMLGMGEDGHTASLFPQTAALQIEDKLVVANYIPEKDLWRMTLTYSCINRSPHSILYVMGSSKATIVETILMGSAHSAKHYPAYAVGTASHPALWMLDYEAGKNLLVHLE